MKRETVIPGGSEGGGPVTYTYDKASNLTTSTSTTGQTVTYSYDAAGVPTSITYPRPTAGSPGLMKFTVDDQGRRTGTYLQTDPSLSTWSARARNTYDANGRVSRVQADTGPSTANIVDTVYCYSVGTTPGPLANCTTSPSSDRAKLQWKYDNLTNKATTYTYNTSGRLVAAGVSPGTTYNYTFDAKGNRTSAAGTSTTTLAFNAANQVTTSGFTYDGSGNLTNDPSTSTSAITYTSADQLRSVTKSGAVYAYTHAGVDNVELLRQTSPTGTYATTYGRNAATGVPVVEKTSFNNGAQTFNTSVVSDPVTGTPLMLRTDNGAQSMYVFDGTPGAPIALISSAPTEQFGYDYDPFGVPTIMQDSGGQGLPQNPYTFGGTGVKDRTTGWVHYANRYYNPITGTWTQPDDLDAPLDPSNGNRYAYAGGDPINNTDPTGRELFSDLLDLAEGCYVGAAAGSIIGATSGLTIAAVGSVPGGVAGGTVGCAVGVTAAGAGLSKPPGQP